MKAVVTRAAMVLLAVAGVAVGQADAQTSGRPVTVVVPYTAGTGVDVAARLLAAEMEKRMGQPFVVDNRPGASGNIGAQFVARAEPDGHTLMMAAATYVKNATVLKNVPYDVVKSFTPIVMVSSFDFVLAVNSALPVKSLKEFIAYVKERPGEINYGSPGFGTPHHLGMELLQLSTKVELAHIPYKGAGGMYSNFLGNHVSATFMPLQVSLGMAKGGKIRPLAVASERRAEMAPDIPTFDEQGVPGFDIDSWQALLGPAGMPKELVERYNKVANEALKNPALRKAFVEQGMAILGGPPERLADRINKDFEKWSRIAQEANLVGK